MISVEHVGRAWSAVFVKYRIEFFYVLRRIGDIAANGEIMVTVDIFKDDIETWY